MLPLSLGTFAVVGLTLALRRPEHPVGWLFLIAGAGWVAWFALPAYAWRSLVEAPGLWPGGEVAAWLTRLILVPAGATVVAVVLFPTGRPPSRIWVPVLGLVVGTLIATITVVAFAPERIVLQRPWFADDGEGWRVAIPNPVGVGGPLGDALSALGPVLGAVTGVPLVLLLIAAPLFRFARSSDVERLQLKWFACAASFSAVLLVIGFAVPTSIVGNLVWGAGILALGLIPIAVGIAILRYRLYEIDLLINRSLAYAALSALIIAFYLGTVTLLGAVLRQPENTLVSAVAALLVALLFSPLRARVQRAVDHVAYGEREEPYAVVRELGRRLGEALDPDSVLPTVARTVAGSLRLPYVGIELVTSDGERIVASHGTPGDATVRLPLIYQQAILGHLLASPRPGERALAHRDLEVLEALAGQAGVAAHGVHVTGELRRARERLVVAREEERRRLLRDLHDELGPRLASHALLVDAARTALARDQQRADALLAELAQETRRSVEEVRRIARGLRPPALAGLGLAEALRDAAAQCASSHLDVVVDVADEVLTSIPVETAAYHVAREALANVLRHSDASWCAVRLHRADGALVLEVEDDGRGVSAGAVSGIGFHSMRERPAEVGGECSIGHRPGGGTRVIAVFPLGGTA